MKKIHNIQRVRLLDEVVKKLDTLHNKSRFVRDAINEKLQRDFPKLFVRSKK